MKIVKYGDGASSRPYESFVIKNSETVFVGGTVKLLAGVLEPADAVTDLVYGICVGFLGADGSTPYENLLDGQKGSGDVFTKGVSLAVHSNNETVAKIRAKVVPIQPNDVIRGVADDTLGTTTGSDKIGYYINILTTDESKFEESTTSATVEQFIIVGHPVGNVANMLDVKLVEGQLFGQ